MKIFYRAYGQIAVESEHKRSGDNAVTETSEANYDLCLRESARVAAL